MAKHFIQADGTMRILGNKHKVAFAQQEIKYIYINAKIDWDILVSSKFYISSIFYNYLDGAI